MIDLPDIMAKAAPILTMLGPAILAGIAINVGFRFIGFLAGLIRSLRSADKKPAK